MRKFYRETRPYRSTIAYFFCKCKGAYAEFSQAIDLLRALLRCRGQTCEDTRRRDVTLPAIDGSTLPVPQYFEWPTEVRLQVNRDSLEARPGPFSAISQRQRLIEKNYAGAMIRMNWPPGGWILGRNGSLRPIFCYSKVQNLRNLRPAMLRLQGSKWSVAWLAVYMHNTQLLNSA